MSIYNYMDLATKKRFRSFSFQFIRLLLLGVDLLIDGGHEEGFLISGEGQERGREHMELVEDVVRVHRFRVALLDQFFASSFLSSIGMSKPLTSCTFAAYSENSPGVSMVVSRETGSCTP